MKNSKRTLFIAILVIVSLSCNFLFPTTNKDGVVPGDLNLVFDEIPIYDPAALPPSPGAASLRALAVLEPGVAGLVSDVEAAEQAALIALISDLQSQLGPSENTELLFLAAQPGGEKMAMPAPAAVFPADQHLTGEFDDGISTAHDAGIITAIISGWSSQLAPSVPTGGNASGSFTGKQGGATTTDSMNIGRTSDGSTQIGFGTKTEATKNGVSASTETAASIEGERCPNAAGQVSFTIKLRLGAVSGGNGYTQDLTAFVRAEVNEDADISSTTFDLTQGTRQVKDGRELYVETGLTVKYKGDDIAGRDYSNVRMIRHSSNVTQADATPMSMAGNDAALTMAHTALGFAERNWLNGGCIKIVATSPGTVQSGSTTEIPVTVTHRFDGAVVPSKLEAALSGGASVSPTKLGKTPGTISYTAPDEKNKSATITLTATSRRGRATLALAANTGGGHAYRVSGVSTITYSGEICSLDKPFVLNGTFPNGHETLVFTPSSPTGGTVEESGNSSTCTNSGGGSYTVTLNEQGSGVLQWTDTITSDCPPYSTTKTLDFELPLNPSPDLSCP